ncbi:MAG: 5-methyltetrahydropteroyltriglutamate--homocysteine S-methyltransferase [Phycisphaeraceae bacterium JB051]
MLTHTLGFPRIGLNRELKRAQENFWAGKIDQPELRAVASDLRMRHWQLQQDAGVDLIPVGDFSFYDQVLDTTAMLGNVPTRYNQEADQIDLSTYFQMARGAQGIAAMEMSKWFDTNYHYIVPEFNPDQQFKLSTSKLVDELDEAIAQGINAKPVIVGPFTYIKLGKSMAEGFDRWDHVDAIVSVYEQLLAQLEGKAQWLQIDEPALVLDLSEAEREAFKRIYPRLTKAAPSVAKIIATYFAPLRENTELACHAGFDAVHIDLAHAPEQLDDVLGQLGEKALLSLGIVNGRNIWRVDADAAIKTIESVTNKLGKDRVLIGSSCSLLHVPVDLQGELKLDADLKSWLAFAKQKCEEIKLLGDAAQGQGDKAALQANRDAWKNRRNSFRVTNPQVQSRMAKVTVDMAKRCSSFLQRKSIQQDILNLPLLPTTTIGSFPQTTDIRNVRRQYKQGEIDHTTYTKAMEDSIKQVVDRQHELGIDVLVHGEPERNDMVEYFGEQLSGIGFTQNGWVQSYGSRCVKPPVIFGDVSRPVPMTVDWARYAQSLTDKPMKGMLTGPITILCWSFVRDDQPRHVTCKQIALAIRDEVSDLEAAGIKIIQVDEAALREGLPLRRDQWEGYLEHAVEAFRLTTSSVADQTQIHTHMCYSEFNDIVDWIAKMDADVVSIEASRSKMELLLSFEKFEYPKDFGPGVYDIHSPRVPSKEEMVELLKQALDVLPADRLWVNPDCGLKTRAWPQTLASLSNMVAAAREVRASQAQPVAG